MIRSFRARLVVTVIALVAVTAAALSVGAYLLVRRSLRAQVVDDALARAQFNVGVLADAEVLPTGAGRPELEASGLVERFLLRGTDGVFVEFPSGGESFASELALVDTPELVDAALRRLVDEGILAYQFLDVAGEPTLVVAARRPPAGPDFYFFSSTAEVGDALGNLRRALLGGGLALVAVAALAAGGISRRVLRPVRQASAAAEAMAAGDLSVRLPAEGRDEFATWAEAFNRMAASLQEKVAALQAARERERRFVADVSHELRTPLTSLINEAAMVRDHLASMPDADQRLGELLVSDTGRIRHLVEELLEISRLDAGTVAAEADAPPIDLARFVEAVAAERHPAARVALDPLPRPLQLDRLALERILGNLLDNARAHAPGADVQVAGGVHGDWLRIVVADDGPGVRPGDLDRLFDRFFKADAARGGGSGLGLAIAREHARRLGGDLTARAGEAGGLVFELLLPVTQPLPAGDPHATVVLEPGVERKDT